MRTRAALAFTLALAASGCGPGGPEPPSDGGADADADADAHHGCTTGFVGDMAQEPELVLDFLGPGGALTLVMDGGPAPLMFPPQGGRVIFAGARARNLETCGATITGA